MELPETEEAGDVVEETVAGMVEMALDKNTGVVETATAWHCGNSYWHDSLNSSPISKLLTSSLSSVPMNMNHEERSR